MTKLSLQISDMMCEGCQGTIQSTLDEIDGIQKADVSLEHKSAEITFDSSKVNQKKIIKSIKEAGYSVDSAKQLA